MKIYLIKTPELQPESMKDVHELLAGHAGPAVFLSDDYAFDPNQFPFLNKYWPEYRFQHTMEDKKKVFDKDRSVPLSWQELFLLCDHFRKEKNIPDGDFVVLLTMRKNALNWFSHCSRRNIFVHAGDWHHFTSADPRYPIAYQVTENIVQALMCIDNISIPNEFVHEVPKGCINDLCMDKHQVMLKLRTADICESCHKKIQQEGIDGKFVKQAFDIFEHVRKGILGRVTAKQPADPCTLVVEKGPRFLLPDMGIEIRLYPLFSALYLLLLKYTEGIRVKDLSDYREELAAIYHTVCQTDNQEKVEANISSLVDPLSGHFSQKKSKINKTILSTMGPELAPHYQIQGIRGGEFRINLPRELLDLRVRY